MNFSRRSAGLGAGAAACGVSTDSDPEHKLAPAADITIPESGAKLPSGDAEVRWMTLGPGSKSAFFKAFLPAYEEKHPNITIGWDELAGDKVREALALQLRNGKAELLQTLHADGSFFPGSASLSDQDARGRMPQGMAGMIFSGAWTFGGWQALNPDFRISVAKQPAGRRDRDRTQGRCAGVPGRLGLPQPGSDPRLHRGRLRRPLTSSR